jgi:hypothetical protein
LLNHSTVSSDNAAALREQAFKHFGYCFDTYKGYTKGEPVPVCDWFDKHVQLEPHYYDFNIPPGYVTPLTLFCTTQPWKMLLFGYDPYEQDIGQETVFTNPRFVANSFAEKDEIYMPKTFLIEHLELGWVGYDDFEDCVFIHHLQMRGGLRGFFNANDMLWIYRYMIRLFPQLMPPYKRSQIFVVDATTLLKYSERTTSKQSIVTPYSGRVLQKSDFHKVTYREFEDVCPIAASFCKLADYLAPEEIILWRYDFDNSFALAHRKAI